jgi:hypothetical protein
MTVYHVKVRIGCRPIVRALPFIVRGIHALPIPRAWKLRAWFELRDFLLVSDDPAAA